MVVKLIMTVLAFSIPWPSCRPTKLTVYPVPTSHQPQPAMESAARIEYNGAILVCDEPVHDVGTRWIGPPIEHKFAIRNEGVAVGWFRVFYSLVGVLSPCEVAIEPGETIYIAVSMRSNKLRGKFEKSITVRLLSEPPDRIEQPWCIRRQFESACEATETIR